MEIVAACPWIISGITTTSFLIYSEFSAIHAHFCVNSMAMPRRRKLRLAGKPRRAQQQEIPRDQSLLVKYTKM
jgi:hypothetical protein